MMKKYLFVLMTTVLFCCTPYDSNKVNHKLIQGEWIQVDLVSYNEQLAPIDEEIAPQNASLYFWGDSCLEHIRDIEKERYFKFNINNFIIGLEEGGHPTSYLKIAKLTNDSLILLTDVRVLRYARKD